MIADHFNKPSHEDQVFQESLGHRNEPLANFRPVRVSDLYMGVDHAKADKEATEATFCTESGKTAMGETPPPSGISPTEVDHMIRPPALSRALYINDEVVAAGDSPPSLFSAINEAMDRMANLGKYPPMPNRYRDPVPKEPMTAQEETQRYSALTMAIDFAKHRLSSEKGCDMDSDDITCAAVDFLSFLKGE